MNRKTLLITIGALLAVAIALYFIVFASSGEQNRQTYARWISAHTSGTVSAHSAVKVYFTQNIVSVDQTGIALSDGAFEISPKTKGQAIWVQPNVLEYTPAEPFKNGTQYHVEVDLSEMVDSLKVDAYEFDFNVIEQNFNIEIEGLAPVDIQKADMLKVYGNLKLADKAEADVVGKMLQATVGDKSYKVKWEADKSGRFFQFTIDSIARTEKSRVLTIQYTGEPLNISNKGTTTYKIPSKNEFIITGYKVQQHPDQQVVLYFSDPIKRYQELSGLVGFEQIDDYQVDVAGNQLIIQPVERQKIQDELTIRRGIESTNDKTLSADTVFNILFEELKPAVRAKSDDVILPPGEQGALFAFEAVNLKAVDVRVYRVYENNIIQFLQVNSLDDNRQLNRVGKPVFEQTVMLEQFANTDLGQWNTFYIDLNKIVEQAPGALYHVQIGFRKENAITQCDELAADKKAQIASERFWKNFSSYSYGNSYSWRHRDDPCHEYYYGFRRAMKHNFMISDIGVIAKAGEGEHLTVFATRLSTTEVLSGATVEVLNYQQQVLKEGKTDANGKIEFVGSEDPYFVKVTDGNHATYLRMSSSEALSYSHFPTDGVVVREGMKGFLYNERGVYRPGDTIYAGFMLHDLTGNLPGNIPVTIELYNARSQLAGKKVLSRNAADHYLVHFPTSSDDETGTWRIKVLVGSRTFTKSIAVETVKPNRLKLDIDTPEKLLADEKQDIGLHVEWLHGAPVSNLKVTVEGAATKSRLRFDDWPGYEFNHQEQQLSTPPQMYFERKLDANGDAKISPYIPKSQELPAKVALSYFFKVFEPNGNFSIASARQQYFPYTSYVGIRLPEPTGRYNMYQTDKEIAVDLAATNVKGEKMSSTVRAKVKVYKVAWSWWWESASDFGYRYRRYKKLKKTDYVNIKNGRATYNLSMDRNEWGRYLIEVTNMRNQQVASKFIYFDWPSIAGRSNRPDGVSQNMLRFATDKEQYETGEKVSLSFPTEAGGKALVSIENGVKVIEDYWVDTQDGETSFSFKATPQMSPNCYINIHYLQSYSRTANDLPLRLYGVAGIKVTDPEKKIYPVIEMDGTIESGEEFEITISEQYGKAMNYSIAIVDEGLLALTNFTTPDPYAHFFSHEALGVMTYDIFDWVIGAFSSTIERVIGIGGGAMGDKDPSQVADQRFKPVVIVEGPFNLEKGKSYTHKMKLPPYIGEVRTMVVARSKQAFGKAERSTKVKSPLMVMATAPRKLVMKDQFVLPVNVFRDQTSGGSVTVEVKHDNKISVDNPKRRISFESGQQEKMIYFDCVVGKAPGSTKFSIHAMDGSYTAMEPLFVEIYNPTPVIYNVNYVRLDDNESRTVAIDPIGAPGTNDFTAEIATMPPFNIQKHFHYLLNYPHGCIEQTVSGVFGLVYAPKIIQLTDKSAQRMKDKIAAALQKLRKFQTNSGGLAYWPGSRNVNEWSTNYAGHFMLVAREAGYQVDRGLLNKWIRYQKTMARNWVDNGPTSRYNQAYRLYTLALADKPARGPMNRLRSIEDLHPAVQWRLAAAYAVAGRERAAEKLITSLSVAEPIETIRYTYGSSLREQAMVLQTLDYLGKETEAFNLIAEMSDAMIEDRWYSTQTRAWVMYAIADFYRKRDVARKIDLTYAVNNGKKNTVQSSKHVASVDFPLEFSLSQNIRFTNQSGGEIFLQMISQGKPLPKEMAGGASNLSIDVQYLDFNQNPVSVSQIDQTTDFIAQIKVRHPGVRRAYKDLALTYTAPGGWEIINTRFTDFDGEINESNYTYRDFRDTRVMTYFDLAKSQEKVFYIKLNASYPGRFYLAPVSVEAMYDHAINARTQSKFVKVKRKE